MFKIGLFGSAAAAPIVLSPVNWADAIAIQTTTTGSGLITWTGTQPSVNLRIVSSNIQQNPFLTNGNGSFRILTNTSNTTTGATITTYTSLDFTISVAKNTYIWFRLGPAEVSRDITVYNASNNDALVDTLNIIAGPFVSPIFSGMIADTRITSTPLTHNYTLQTIQVSNVPTTTNVYLNWYLTSGTNLPRVFYAKNYSGITTTGPTSIFGSTVTPDAFTPAFTEVLTPGSGTLISVANGDFLTFAVVSTATYSPGTAQTALLEVYNSATANQIVGSAPIKTVDI